ncbi:hypothetical protein EJ357_13515 [Streptomyces cyaneochromogenes]|uniref:Uncharacterized protein n=1 Tax=Streptomyces cyaneochromogenes TaxID=2496836 RepID=A0A3S9M595_9ACTN|nr:hypothetical protein [Streptomyces cyaneochromogenes]AZQ34371.1 hypothetical protein EJ357_13515 [Streptomyces cyaneochromogenes]
MRTAHVLVRHELRLVVSLWLWAARRRHGLGEGTAFGYSRGQGTMMLGFGFVIVIESIMMSVLLRNHPAVQRAWFMLDMYTLLIIIGLHAASVVRPHVLDAGSLRVRRAAHVDLRIPLEKIAHVRRELRTTHEQADGELNLAIGAQTTVTLELTEPVAHVTFLGRRRDVRLVRLHADDATDLVHAINAIKPARTSPSPQPDRLV